MYKYIPYNVYSECKHYHNEGLTDDDIHDDDHGNNETMETYHDSNVKSSVHIHDNNLEVFFHQRTS
jgi:hypothetical protein